MQPAPHSFTPNEAAVHFGVAAKTLYNWINDGRLIRGKHYLKIGTKKILIIREAFIEYLEECDGCRSAGRSGGDRLSADVARRAAGARR
jgi:excisionase family DNA binding protein